MNSIRLLLLLICLIPILRSGAEAAPRDDVESLVRSALENNLHQHPNWHRLLHYRKNLLGGLTSEADAPEFFLSPEGKSRPDAELAATLRHFYQPDGGSEAPHAQCRFPARLKWLKAALSLESLPAIPCTQFDQWRARLAVQNISLVFASYYPSNPASMFGHTFLKLNTGSENRDLLGHGVNFAAVTGEAHPMLYAFKGMTGGFPGRFTIFPFYLKVQEYSNWESRDLWEYQLNLGPDQIDSLLRHLWELGETHFDYFYLDENCSYHLLALLEAAYPRIQLTGGFPAWVLPAETVKVVREHPGLVAGVRYRPAILNQMRHKTGRMNRQERSLLRGLAAGPNALQGEAYRSLAPERKALVLDAYLDYLQYQAMHVQKEDPERTLRMPHSVLLERSRLKVRSKEAAAVPLPAPPDATHGPTRLHAGAGVLDNETFLELGAYPALHDLLAVSDGYPENTQYLFFDLNLRYYTEPRRFRLDRLNLVDILSLEPFDLLFRRLSWRLHLGWDNPRDLDCDFCTTFNGGGSAGLTYQPHRQSAFLLYALVDLVGETSGHLAENFRAGGGISGGTLLDLTRGWKLQLTGQYRRFMLGQEGETWSLGATQRYAINRQLDMRLEYRRIEKKDEVLLGLNLFF